MDELTSYRERLNNIIQIHQNLNNQLNVLLNERSELGLSRPPAELTINIQNVQNKLEIVNRTRELAANSFQNLETLTNLQRRCRNRPSNYTRTRIADERENFSQIIDNFYSNADFLVEEVMILVLKNSII